MTARARPELLLGAVLLGWLAFAPPAHAVLNCSTTLSKISFANLDTLAGTAVTTTATIDVSCTGIGIGGVRVCPYLGDGSGGRDGSARYLQGPSETIAYQLYTDSGHTSVWGDTTFGAFPTVDFTGNLAGTATASTSLTVYGLIFAGQDPVPEGTYSSNFTTADVDIQWGVNLLGLVSCSGLQIFTNSSHPTAIASTLVERDCLISTSAVSFGSHGLLTVATTASGGVTVRCTPDTAFAISLSNGLTGSGPTARLMTKGLEAITYGLYKDSGHTQPWGTSGGEDVSGTGTGSDQAYVVHARVPAQATPSPGLYEDTVVATVTY